MYQIAIIGAGQLGSRHLQALARIALPCEINVIDPSGASLALAQARFAEMPANPAIGAVRYGESVDTLPAELDYVIVATSSDIRLAVMETLLTRCKVRHMLLEKVLFQRQGDYPRAHALLQTHGVRSWVNCPRRIFPIYREMGEFFGAAPLHHLQVVGGEWGLGCNSIHFLDAFGQLAQAVPSEFSVAGLDAALLPSKRKNFMEFTGALACRFGEARCELISLPGSAARVLVTVRSDTRTCILDEGLGQAFWFDGSAWTQTAFRMPFLSDFATAVATEILTGGECALPTYEQSQVYHLPLLAALGAHASVALGTAADICPIT
jgi:hypothetical protein